MEKQIPETMKARNMSEDQVIKDVLLAAQPTKEFVTVEQIASLALFLCSGSRTSSPVAKWRLASWCPAFVGFLGTFLTFWLTCQKFPLGATST